MDSVNNRLIPVPSALPGEPRTSSLISEKQDSVPADTVAVGTSGAPADGESVKITILHTNDLHGHLTPFHNKKEGKTGSKPDAETDAAIKGGLARIANTVNEERAKNPGGTLLLDAGDISTGSFVADYFKGEPMVKAMNVMGYDAMTVGNHEFDKGKDSLKALIEKADFPVLSANMVDKTGGIDPLPVQQYVIKEVNGVKVGILGLTTPRTLPQMNVEDRKEIDFLAAADTASRLVPQMRSEGAQLVIALTHEGDFEDRALANAVPGIDVIVGGHSHTELPQHEVVNNTLIVQTGSLGKNLGELELDVTRQDGKVSINGAASRLIYIGENVPADPKVEAVIKTYTDQMQSIMGRVVGKTDVDLITEDYHVSQKESNMADFVTDTVREYAGTDFCLFPPSTFRANIPKGDVKVEDVYLLYPWDDGLSKVSMTGRTILSIIEAGLDDKALRISPSGLRFTYDPAKPKGQRVVDVKTNDGKPLDLEKVYTVAARNFALDNEGKGKFTEYHNYLERSPLKDSCPEILIKRFETGIPVNQQVDGRIQTV